MQKILTLFTFIILSLIKVLNAQIAPGNIYITNDTNWSNTVTIEGNVFIDSNVTLTVMPGTFVNITGYYAFYCHGTIKAVGTELQPITFTHLNTLHHNDTSTVSGGWHGIRLLPRSANDTSFFEYCTITNGKAVVPGSWLPLVNNYPDNRGANIYGVDFGNLIIKNSFVGNGISKGDGGGIFLENGQYVLIDSSHFEYNHCYNVFGGGARIRDVMEVIITNNLFNHNRAYYISGIFSSGHGGGIAVSNSYNFLGFAKIVNNRFFNNYTNIGVIYNTYYSTIFSNNLICNNYGTGIMDGNLLSNMTRIYSNNTIAYNSSVVWAGMDITSNSQVHFINNIIWMNKQDIQIHWDNVNGVPPTILYSDVMLGYEGEGNLDTNPEFVNPTESWGVEYDALEANWSLKDDSPLINAGVPDTTGWNIPALDFTGNPRVYGARIDMGAIENQNVLVSLNERNALNNNVFLYPNPGQYSVKVHLPVTINNAKLYLLDVSGRIILTQSVRNQKSIDISNLPSGIYFYKIIVAGAKVKTGKWIKQ